VRISVWSAEGVAEAALSLQEDEAERLGAFLSVPEPRRDLLSSVLGRRAAAYRR
jgi:hypothetical protein